MDGEAEQQLARILQLPRNVLNDTQMEAGIIYTGLNTRTRRIVSRMLAGEPILVGVITKLPPKTVIVRFRVWCVPQLIQLHQLSSMSPLAMSQERGKFYQVQS